MVVQRWSTDNHSATLSCTWGWHPAPARAFEPSHNVELLPP